MKSIISRTLNKTETLGSWYIFDGEKLCYRCKTIELPWLNNEHNISCIPSGTYDIKKIVRPNGKNAFHVENVKDRENILVHIGNFASGSHKDTLGCILPGLAFTDINTDGFVDIIESTVAFNKLWETLPDTSQLLIL